MGDQLDLFAGKRAPDGTESAGPTPEEIRERTLEQKFGEFHTENPHVLVEMLKLARAKLDAGERRIGAKALWEELRSWLQTTGQPYKLNNSYTALYARELVKLEPRLEGVIEMRRRKS